MPQVDPSEYGGTGGDLGYASWGRRVAGAVSDAIVIGLLALVVTGAFGHPLPWDVLKTRIVHGQQQLVPIGGKLRFLLAANVILGFLYNAGFLASSWRATPCMRLLSIRLAVEDGTHEVNPGRVIARTALYSMASALAIVVSPVFFLLILDALWPLWDRRNQTLHDKCVGTVVRVTALGV